MQQHNQKQKAGNKANLNHSMTAPSFKGDHSVALSSMGKAQVAMNKSKVAFKGATISKIGKETTKGVADLGIEIGAAFSGVDNDAAKIAAKAASHTAIDRAWAPVTKALTEILSIDNRSGSHYGF